MAAKNAKDPSEAPRQPFLGAVVLFIDPHMGDTYPGIVTRVLTEGRVALTVFQPGTAAYPAPHIVEFDPTMKAKGTWHWRPQLTT